MPVSQDLLVNDPVRLLADLNPAQREAVEATTGPLVIVAGAGTGKTRVISRRAAYAIETGAAAADRMLLVTFTEKAAREMADRMTSLGHPGVLARTFHAAALAQIRHFWPLRHGEELPATLESKVPLLVPLIGRLPGHYRFTPSKDIADVIEWAKVRRIDPARWEAEGGDRAPIPADLFARLYRDYERTKARTGRLDFEDMLVRTVELLETDAQAAELVQRRRTWFSVDEYQDTNPLAERLLTLWAGPSRDVAVVGDPDQTIYTFTGASPEFLLRFEERHPGARRVVLRENHRSTAEVLAFANRLLEHPPDRALTSTRERGPTPTITSYATDNAEAVGLVASVRHLLSEGVAASEIAVLVRINAQLPPLEEELTRAGIGFVLRGQHFYDRREIRDARRLLARRRAALAATGAALLEAIRELFREELGFTGADGEATEAAARGVVDAGAEGREREASLELLLAIVAEHGRSNAEVTIDGLIEELDRRAALEAAGGTEGVNLLTYHRAKGLEWDAVLLPALEEGLLPIRHAKEDAALAEERRLLYVGITRARTHLFLSWAHRRVGPGGKETSRRPSRFLRDLGPSASRPDRQRGAAASTLAPRPPRTPVASEHPDTLEALRAWRRRRAADDAVPAYVVAHDSTLAAIADARPLTIVALRRVNGMGPAKLERYGAEIIDVIAASVGN